MTREEWRPVKDWPYEVSSMGHVRRAGSEKPLNPGRVSNGYLCVYLHDAPRKRPARVHRLVLAAFVGPCPPGHEADHINAIRDDNRVENLRWLPIRINRRHNILGEDAPAATLTEQDVVAIRKRSAAGERYDLLAQEYGVSSRAIRLAVQGETWSHVGGPTTEGGSRDGGGHTNPNAALSYDQAVMIRVLYRSRQNGKKVWTYSDLAARFGVASGTIRDLISGRTYV